MKKLTFTELLPCICQISVRPLTCINSFKFSSQPHEVDNIIPTLQMMKLRHREPNLIHVSQLLNGRAKSETEAVQLQDLALNHCPELVRLSEPEGTTEGDPVQSPHFTDIQRWDVNSLQVFPTQLLRVRQLKSMCHLGRQKTLENGGDYGQLGRIHATECFNTQLHGS